MDQSNLTMGTNRRWLQVTVYDASTSWIEDAAGDVLASLDEAVKSVVDIGEWIRQLLP